MRRQSFLVRQQSSAFGLHYDFNSCRRVARRAPEAIGKGVGVNAVGFPPSLLMAGLVRGVRAGAVLFGSRGSVQLSPTFVPFPRMCFPKR
jgi:hypothetical protein